MNPENLERKILIPEAEIEESFSRGGGPGGQNVNKVATKVELRWRVDASTVFSDEEKARIREVLANRINKEGELIVTAQRERSQLKNREIAYGRLNELVAGALVPEIERIKTRPTAGSREKRIEEKKVQSSIKRGRRKPEIEE